MDLGDFDDDLFSVTRNKSKPKICDAYNVQEHKPKVSEVND